MSKLEKGNTVYPSGNGVLTIKNICESMTINTDVRQKWKIEHISSDGKKIRVSHKLVSMYLDMEVFKDTFKWEGVKHE